MLSWLLETPIKNFQIKNSEFLPGPTALISAASFKAEINQTSSKPLNHKRLALKRHERETRLGPSPLFLEKSN